MKSSVYLVLCVLLSSVVVHADELPKNNDQKNIFTNEHYDRNKSNNQDAGKKNDTEEDEFYKSKSVKFPLSLLYNVIVKKTPKDQYEEPNSPFFRLLFNKEAIMNSYRRKLDNGEEIIFVPKGSEYPKQKIDPVKATFWGLIGIGVVVAIYNGFTGNKNSQQPLNSNQKSN